MKIISISVLTLIAFGGLLAAPSWEPVQFATIATEKQEIGGYSDQNWWHGTLVGGLTCGNLVRPVTGNHDATLAAFDRKGRTRWLQQYDSGRSELIRGVRASFWHGIRVAYKTQINQSQAVASIRRLDGKGREVWTYTLPKEEDIVAGIGLGDWGRSYMVSLRTEGSSILETTFWIVDRQGKLINKVPVLLPGGRFHPMQLTQSGNDSFLIQGGLGLFTGGHRMVVVNLNKNGTIAWTWTAPETDWRSSFGISVDKDGRMLVVGQPPGLAKSVLLAVSPEGKLEKRIELDNDHAKIEHVCIGGDGKIYIPGTESGAYLSLLTLDHDFKEVSREQLDMNAYTVIEKIWMDSSGRLALSGSYSRTLFGHPSKGQNDQFLLRLARKKDNH